MREVKPHNIPRNEPEFAESEEERIRRVAMEVLRDYFRRDEFDPESWA